MPETIDTFQGANVFNTVIIQPDIMKPAVLWNLLTHEVAKRFYVADLITTEFYMKEFWQISELNLLNATLLQSNLVQLRHVLKG